MNANKENKAETIVHHSSAALSKRSVVTRALNVAMIKEATGKSDLLLITSLSLQGKDDLLPKIQVLAICSSLEDGRTERTQQPPMLGPEWQCNRANRGT